MKYKFLNLNGLERFLNKVKGIIPTKTSELQNDSGFITAQGTYDSALSDTSEQAVQNKVIKQALDGKADDSSVVHNTGNETIEGSKTFTSDMPLKLKSSDVEISAIPSSSTNNAIRFTDKNNTIIADVKYSQYPSGNSEFGLNLRTKDTNNNTISKSVTLNADQNGTWYQFRPSDNSEIGLGSSNYRWKSVHADNYYKGTTAFGDIVTHDDSEYADASHTHTASEVSGLATVATSGSYNDLSNKPTIPTVNNKTLTIKKNGTSLGTFTANSGTDETVDITVPTKTSDITNDSGFLTSHNPVDSALSGTSVNAVQNKVVKSALDGKSDTGHTHTTSDITDLSIPSKVSDLTNDSGFITGVSWNDVSGKPSSFTPSSHSHGSITNDGKLGTAANKPLITGANGVISTGSFGTSANTFCQGNDSRLSDARTPLSHTHGNSDITSLDASKLTGTIDIARLPKGALERLVTVADQTARFALTSSDVQLGDTVKQLDTGVMYIVSDESKLNSADGYTEYTAGSATSVPWSGVTGKPSSYTPSSHTHGNITNDGKLGTASKVLISDSNKKITTSSVSDTELGYLSGVTSAIQTQISGKANASHTHSASDITSGLATVATSGSYNDLSNKPTIPTVNNATLTIQKNGTTVKTFTANASSNVTANITVPTKTSELTNDSGYLTSHQDISGLSAKADTIKSLSISGRTITYTKGDDTTGTLTTQDNNTWTAMVGATSSANGSVGYVNAVPPKDGYNTKYLRADGTWAVPPDHTYTVNNKTLTIQKNGTSVATFTANSASDVTANIVVPTKTSDLTNDSHQTITVSTDTTSTASPAHSGTFTCIDSVTRDSNGHVTKVNTKTITLPSDNNTDTKVTQTASNSNAYYPVLVANTNIANTGTLPTTSTEGVRKSYSLSVNTRYGFLYGRNPYDTDNLKGSVAGGNRTSAAMYSLTYDNAVVGAVELGRVDKYGNRYSRLYASNYITDGALATDGTVISSVLDIGVLSNGLQYISTSGGWYCNVYPCTTNERSLGTAALKWANVYATTFTGNLTGNVTGNVTGNCSGSSGSCTGNAATATKATGNANGKELTNTIIKGLSVSGKTITYTQIDGTTGTITTQDTNTDTLMTQNVSTTNATYPILLCATANATANQGAKTGIFGSGVKVNPSTSTISATTFSGALSGNASSATQFSANKSVTLTGDVTGTASSKAGWSVATTLSDSGVTAGTYGPSADVTGNNNATISVPEITVDSKGRVTSVTNRTLTCKNNTYNVYNKTLTIQKNGTNVATFTSNSNTDVTANITVPTKTSELTNDSGFLTSHQSLANYLTKTTNVSEMGRYIDLHYDNATSKYDYDVRLYVDSQGTTAGGGSFKILAATAYAPAPAADANDTRIATTKWVKDRGFLTSHQSLSSCVKNVVTNNQIIKSTAITRGTAPSSKQIFGITFSDNNGKQIGNVYGQYATDKSTYVGLYAYNGTTTADRDNVAVLVGYDASGNAYTYAPTPATTDNSTQIATTAFVKAQGYVTLNGDQTISGAKRFSSNVTVNLGSSTDSGYNITANVSRKDVGDGKFYGTYINAGSSSGPGTLGIYGYIRNTDGTSELQMRLVTSKTDGSYILKSLQFQADRYGNTWQFIPNANNTINLGTSSNKWKTAHAVNFYENGTALSSKYVQINALAGGNAAGSLTSSVGSLVLARCASSSLSNVKSYGNISGNLLYPCRTEVCTTYDATGYHYVPIVVRHSSDSNLGSGTWRYLGGSTANVNSDVAEIYGMFLRVA